jgi:hypothetical protein
VEYLWAPCAFIEPAGGLAVEVVEEETQSKQAAVVSIVPVGCGLVLQIFYILWRLLRKSAKSWSSRWATTGFDQTGGIKIQSNISSV